MTPKVSLQHRLKLRIAASTLDVLGQSISNDIAHGGLLDLRDGPHPLREVSRQCAMSCSWYLPAVPSGPPMAVS